jgi:hypothetical protein
MDATWFEALPVIALAIALAACAGLRAWLPLLLAGGLARAGFLQLGPTFGFLSSDRALVLLALATVIEIAGDKFPAVDHALDALSTVLRPAAGTLLAASVLGTVSDPLTAWILGLIVGAPTSLVPHVAKSGLRLASTALTAGLANPLVSVAEDVGTVVMVVLAVVAPVVVCALLLAMLWLVARRFQRPRPVTA